MSEPAIVFRGHLYGYGRNKTSDELAQEIRADLDRAHQDGKFPREVEFTVTALCLAEHSSTILIVVGGPVHAAEYAKVIAIGSAYNQVERDSDGHLWTHYRLEVLAPASPAVRAHPVTALIGQLGEYVHEWYAHLTHDERDAITVLQHGLERVTAYQALGQPAVTDLGDADQPEAGR